MSEPSRTREVALVFLRLGTIAFGGPVAHTAMMREELVRRRGWVSDERFVDLMGATNLIPGPNSTELAIHLGHDRARGRGLVLAGLCFILPAALIVTGLAWAYVEYGDTPSAEWLLHGVVPAVLGIVAWALVGLLRTVVKGAWWGVLAGAALAAYLLGVNELVVLFGGATVAGLARLATRTRGSHPALLAPLAVLFPDPTAGQLGQLFLTMLKIGSVLYGSGYVLLAFLEGDFVDRLGWVTHQQLLDAISIGQVTPGPLFTTATFLGYLVAGLPGAFLATVGIFLPSFVFVGLLTRITDKLRSSPWTATMLDGLNVAALALMAGVSWQLAQHAIVDGWTVAIFVTALLLMWRTSLNSAWYVAGGAVAGIVLGLLGWA
ncbi:chromate efflux transporter [Nocardioides sp.]|uniref:chromate efflux transporter n=1 Tax=Nocardioides sp. TaxID=35761 RepID=UPI0025EFB6E7|nr:chromate efflux transporter [Nocardioides sp.]